MIIENSLNTGQPKSTNTEEASGYERFIKKIKSAVKFSIIQQPVIINYKKKYNNWGDAHVCPTIAKKNHNFSIQWNVDGSMMYQLLYLSKATTR